ncbi:hypothetical protein [Quadrisphaera sp. DSM 44207]|uniref:hypothetical protein n=1 Tax=Quadrisphaera sp. DSM 44207 TaxID=1881057 RepID=UPI00088BADD7|nr:hypothetical protein [Quadrisphaera sp. DSM 44207]SDQ18270.1 hypothetical protein SAMN05428996_0965 [Quadrisphaera sp. DSM 44207]
MSTPQEQYLQVMQQSQEAILTAVNSWTKTVQDVASGQLATPGQVDPNRVVDQVFDFAEKMLEMQREFAKSLMQGAASLTETMQQRATEVTSAGARAAAEATSAGTRAATGA